jgi:hypothetical protein
VAEPAGPRLSFRRTGGLFAGNVLATSVSPAELDPAAAAELERLVRDADLGSLARSSPIRGPGADVYQYELTLEGAGEAVQLIVGETALPGRLRPLVEWLARHAEQERAGRQPG